MSKIMNRSLSLIWILNTSLELIDKKLFAFLIYVKLAYSIITIFFTTHASTNNFFSHIHSQNHSDAKIIQKLIVKSPKKYILSLNKPFFLLLNAWLIRIAFRQSKIGVIVILSVFSLVCFIFSLVSCEKSSR